MADQGYKTLNDKATHINPMRGFIWTIDFDGDVDSRVHTDLFNDGIFVDMYSQSLTLPSKTMKFVTQKIMGSERKFTGKFEFEHGFSIDFIEDEHATIKAKFEKWLNAFHPMQTDLDGTGQQFMATGDKFDDDGNYDLATNFICTLYKYGSKDGIEGDPIMQYKLNGVLPEAVSEPELNRNETESVVTTKVSFQADWSTLIFSNLNKKQTSKILGITA